MDAKNAIMSRRSIRKFLPDEVPSEMIEELLSAADAAPSACNKKPLIFYVIRNKDILSALSQSGRFTNMDSPLAIVVAGDKKRMLPRSFADYWIQDAAAATENILIMANALGLGACWNGVYLQKSVMNEISKILNFNDDFIPFSLIKIGFPDEKVPPHENYEKTRVQFVN